MSDKFYDVLDFLAENLGYFVILLAAIGEIWNIPYTGAIVATLEAVHQFIKSIVKKAAIEYYSGGKYE